MLQATLIARDTKINRSSNCCAEGSHRLGGGTNFGQKMESTVIDIRRVLWGFRRENLFSFPLGI